MSNSAVSAKRWLATAGVVGFVSSPALRRRPHRAYRAMRRVDPVHASPVGIWVLSRHEEVTAALRHPGLGNDESKADFSAIRLGPLRLLLGASGSDLAPGKHGRDERVADRTLELMRQLMLFRDPPDHTRLRSLVSKAFTPRAVAALETRIAEIATERIQRVAHLGGMDFLTEFAYPIPALVICELMGVPAADHELIASHAPALAARLDPSPLRNPSVRAAADRATSELTAYLGDVIASRRERPGDDILSRLIVAEDEGDRLDHDELVAMIVLLLIAGHETTANLLGNGLFALLDDRRQWERFVDDRTLDRSAVEELMRFDGPIQMVERITLSDLDLGGSHIPSGRIVVLCLAGANRDPVVFEQPDVLNLARDPNPHVGFGGGTHFCLGAPLARLEARVALRTLAANLPGVRLASDRPRWRPSFTIRGLKELPLTWRAP